MSDYIEIILIFTLSVSNICLLTWALILREKLARLRREIFARAQWNWRQARQWRN